jgi:putative transposase
MSSKDEAGPHRESFTVGSRGDSYDNALAETIIGLYKTELIRRCGPWKGIDEVEYATLEWVDWFDHVREVMGLGDVMSLLWAECEAEGGMHLCGQRPVAVELIDPASGAVLPWEDGVRGERPCIPRSPGRRRPRCATARPTTWW